MQQRHASRHQRTAASSNLCNVLSCTPDPLRRLPAHLHARSRPAAGELRQGRSRTTTSTTPPSGRSRSRRPSPEPLARGMYSYTDNSTTSRPSRARQSDAGQDAPPKTWEPRDGDDAPLLRSSRTTKPRDPHPGRTVPVLGRRRRHRAEELPRRRGQRGTSTQAMMDVSEWEGVSFWARRGPDSQAGFRVLVGDKYTDDDIAYLMYRDDPTTPRFCERVRECACLNHKACAPIPPRSAPTAAPGHRRTRTSRTSCRPDPSHLRPTRRPMTFCGTPEVISGAESGSHGGSQCNTCDADALRRALAGLPGRLRDPARVPVGTDRQFYGKPCSPYTMRNGIFSSWCFDPATGEQPGGDDRAVRRPLDARREPQQPSGSSTRCRSARWRSRAGRKRSASSISRRSRCVRFTWDGGWVDFWIDDVRFYKHQARHRRSDRRGRLPALAPVPADRRRRPTGAGARAVRVDLHASADADAGRGARRAGARAARPAGRTTRPVL